MWFISFFQITGTTVKVAPGEWESPWPSATCRERCSPWRRARGSSAGASWDGRHRDRQSAPSVSTTSRGATPWCTCPALTGSTGTARCHGWRAVLSALVVGLQSLLRFRAMKILLSLCDMNVSYDMVSWQNSPRVLIKFYHEFAQFCCYRKIDKNVDR